MEGGDAVVVRGQAVDRRVGLEGPDADGAVGAAGDEGGGAELELADEGGVALEDGDALAREYMLMEGGEVGRRGIAG